LFEVVRNTIEKNKMLTPCDSVLIGLSGGADSVALLFVLRELRGELDLAEISAVHVNHNLRGEESDRDEMFVSKLCDELGISLIVEYADVNGFSQTHKIGTEEAARILRYEILERTRRKATPSHNKSAAKHSPPFVTTNIKIAVGHNLDDNAETVIMNICRGAGLKGLCGIPPVNGAIIRPLIDVPRREIEAYLHERNIPFLTDSSNLSNDYTRNRVRNIIMPALENEVSPSVKKTLSRAANLLRTDEDFLETSAQEAFKSANTYSEQPVLPKPNTVSLNINKLTNLHPAILRRVIRVAILQARKNITDITAAHISAVCDLTFSPSGREIHLPNMVVTREYQQLIFSPQASGGSAGRSNTAHQTSGFAFNLEENTAQSFPIINKTISLSFSAPSAQTSCTKVFSCDKITNILQLRTRKAGDKISFKNADGKIFAKKLQDYFTDEKIPKSQRDSIPLIAHGNEILWILNEKNRTNAKFEPIENEKKIYVSVQ